MKTMFLNCTALMLSLASAIVFAQAPAAPPHAAPPTTATPPPNSGALNPPVQQGATAPLDANGNAIAQPNPSQGTNSGQASGGYSQAAPASANAPITPFAMLDRDKAGAIKMDQARSDAWLAQHFVQCDANHNEEVTQSEYEACTSH